MSRLDQFESAFKSAAKTLYRYEPVRVETALVVSDLDEYQARLFGDRVRSFMSALPGAESIAWQDVEGKKVDSVGALLELVETHRPDLICTYRNLHSGAWRWPFTLGDHLEVLTQVTDTPVLVLPRVDDGAAWRGGAQDTDRVMALTNHLAGDHRLVSFAAACTEADGVLLLAHVEDESVFERYLDAISKIPEIDTAVARTEIKAQLLKEPHDYIRSCRDKLAQASVPVQVEEIVTVGQRLAVFKQLVADHEIDLLVMNTKDEDQLAMHGLAYPLAVELRSVPLMML